MQLKICSLFEVFRCEKQLFLGLQEVKTACHNWQTLLWHRLAEQQSLTSRWVEEILRSLSFPECNTGLIICSSRLFFLIKCNEKANACGERCNVCVCGSLVHHWSGSSLSHVPKPPFTVYLSHHPNFISANWCEMSSGCCRFDELKRRKQTGPGTFSIPQRPSGHWCSSI